MIKMADWNNGTCKHQDCGNSTEWDMASVVVNEEEWFCSPDCAADCIESHDYRVMNVTLHDPQRHVDRSELPDVTDRDTNIPIATWEGQEFALEMIDEIREIYPGEFRVA
jgi:hypothetical protein